MPRNTRRLIVAVAPMQFSDTDAQHKSDAERVFARAEEKGYDCLMGTEAGKGAGNLPIYLARAARRHGYRFHRRHGTWLAVDKGLGRELGRGYVKVIGSHAQENDPNPGNYDPRGIPWLKVDAGNLGVITFGVSHFLTKGRRPQDSRPGPANHYAANNRLAASVGRWAKWHGKGDALVLWGADTNRLDSAGDVFQGLAPMATCWDDTGKHPNTGHGNIDVVARYKGDRDRIAECAWARTNDDSRFPLATDHFLTEAAYDVELLP